MTEVPDSAPQVDGVIFDLDRTLIDVQSFTDYGRALSDVRRLVGAWPDVTTPETGWDGPTRTCMAVLVALSGDPRWGEVSAAIERHEMAAVAESKPMPFLAEAMAATADLPRAVVTLLPERAARAALARHGVAIDMLVPRLPDLRPKPSPDPVTVGARLLDLPPDRLVMTGDSSWDEEASRGAGVPFIGLLNGGRSEFTPEATTVADLRAFVRLLHQEPIL